MQQTTVERHYPIPAPEIRKREYVAHIKPYGRHNAWADVAKSG
jgi:hypothetical protein